VRSCVLALMLLVFCHGVTRAESEIPLERLTILSIEDLLNVQVVTTKKKAESAFQAASSIYVLTRDAIKRSGATNLPEAIRLIPGINVSSVDINHYMVSGIVNNDYFTDKILVLIDGRPVQSLTFSHVWWPAQMYPLEDIERIEAIRGAGAALWGSNAMGGIINIITRPASATHGGYIHAGGGKLDQGLASLRHGGALGETADYRVYAMAGRKDGARFVKGERSANPKDSGAQNNLSQSIQAGFKIDREQEGSFLSLHGDAYNVEANSEGAMFVRPMISTQHFKHKDIFNGYNLAADGKFQNSDDLASSFRVILDRNLVKRAAFEETINSVNGEAQVDYTLGSGNTLTAGATYLYYWDDFIGSEAVSKPNDDGYVYGIFLQDELFSFENRFKTILGARLDKNNFSGWEFQPNLKAAWLADAWTLWGSAARVVRLPNSMNNNLLWVVDSVTDYPVKGVEGPGLLGVISSKGNPDPEEVYTYETGLRLKPNPWMGVDLSVFYSEYKNAISLFEETSQTQDNKSWAPYEPYVYDIYYRNVYDGSALGGTVSVTAEPVFWAHLNMAYTYTHISMTRKADVPENRKHSYADYLRGSTPMHSGKGALRLDLPWFMQLDFIGNYTSEMDALNVRANWRWDVRLAYAPSEKLSVSFTGRNVLKEKQMEWYSPWTYDNSWVRRDYVILMEYNY